MRRSLDRVAVPFHVPPRIALMVDECNANVVDEPKPFSLVLTFASPPTRIERLAYFAGRSIIQPWIFARSKSSSSARGTSTYDFVHF